MQNIYLAKPGGQKEGPYTLEQINRDLATKKYSDADFWAWHEGLPSWLPLYSLPGVSAKPQPSAVPEAKPRPPVVEAKSKPVAPEAKPEPAVLKAEIGTIAPKINLETPTPEPKLEPSASDAEPEPTPPVVKAQSPSLLATPEPPSLAPEPEPPAQADIVEPAAPTAKVESAPSDTKPEPSAPQAELEPEAPQEFAPPSMSSGRPFSALDQVFIFTTGDGPSALKSEMTTDVLQEAVGETLVNIRAKVPVDVIGGVNAAVLETIRGGSIPPSAWRALHGIKPAVAQQAQDGGYHLCVRTFPVESNGLVAMFLLYNKQKF